MTADTHASGTSAPRPRSRRRFMISLRTTTATRKRPRSRVRLLYPVSGPTSGRYPAPMYWNSCGTGTVLDLPTNWFAPRNSSMPASVTMNAGMPT